MIGIEKKGQEIYDLANRLFPICRSLSGEGVRQSIDILQEYIERDGMSFNIIEIPSGTEVFDWTIPKEWVIREAYIEDESGNRIIDMRNNNLHVLGYSLSVDKWVTIEELGDIVFTEPDQPDVIPYVTSYYKDRYGFCMCHREWEELLVRDNEKFHIYIDSELFDGSLTYAECLIQGSTDDEILISSYICHPSMANNECSGPATLCAIMRFVNSIPKRRFTYRFVLNPETIGSIAYISNNLDVLKKNVIAGVVLSCVGDDRGYSIIHSRYGNTLADKSLMAILKSIGDGWLDYKKIEKAHMFDEYSYLKRGSDERQYNAPGVDLPVVGFCRTKYGMYPEYHTSADDMGFVSPSGFQGSYEVLCKWISCLEENKYYKVNVLCEPQLGKRGLYPTVSKKGIYDDVQIMMDFLAYADGNNDIFDISEIIGTSPCTLIPIIHKMIEAGVIIDVAESNMDMHRFE